MANNNRANAEMALNSIDMGDLRVEFEVGKNPKQVTRLYVWDSKGKQVINQSVSALTKQVFFEDLLKDIRLDHATVNSFEEDEVDEFGEDEVEEWDEDFHQASIRAYKKDLIRDIENGESVDSAIEYFTNHCGLTDCALCEQWLDLKKYHKVVKLSNGEYFTDDQLKMLNEVIQMFKD